MTPSPRIRAVSATSAQRNTAVKWIRPPASVSTQATRSRSTCSTLIGQPLAYERGGGEGEPGGSPSVSKNGAARGKHGFPPRERAEGERRSRRDEHPARRAGKARPHRLLGLVEGERRAQ